MSGPLDTPRLGEFELIERYLAPLAANLPGAARLKDDAACLSLPPGRDLVVTSDALAEGVHFLKADGPAAIAAKALRANLSDLAAKGAEPLSYQLILGFPESPAPDWMEAFTAQLAREQAEFGIQLSGGDTIRNPGGLLIGVTALGIAPTGRILRRQGARPGDALFVSGTIGDAALGLEVKLRGRSFGAAADDFFLQRLHWPMPRSKLGPLLIGLADAAMDVSDGLVQDAGHIAAASGCAVVIEAARVPLSAPARAAAHADPALLATMLRGGDDYEILFAAPPVAAPGIQRAAREAGVTVTEIGRVENGSGVKLLDAAGHDIAGQAAGGFRHF